MGAHLIDGKFQSDKYPTCPRGKVPLSVRDKTAQDLLWTYAQRRRVVDAEFSDDLETALKTEGYRPPTNEPLMAAQLRELLSRWDSGQISLLEFEAGVLHVKFSEDSCPMCGGHKVRLGG